MRVVLLAGSPLARPLFEAILRNGDLVGFCTPRLPAGVGFHEWARQAGLPWFAADRRGEGLGGWLESVRADCLLAFTFPYRLAPAVIGIPRLGCFNFHGGRLPEYRGPQPVFWQIANREPEGALCVHRMSERYDCGPVVANLPISIAPEETYGRHAVRLAHAAGPLAERLLREIESLGPDLPETPQDEARARYQPRPTPDDLMISWEDLQGDEIRALIKAGNPWNQGAFAAVRGVNLRLTDVTLLTQGGSSAEPPGSVLLADPEKGLVINCRDGSALRVDIVSTEDGILGSSLAALGIRVGERFTSALRG